MAQDQISRRRLLGLLVAAGAASQPRAALAEGLSGDPEASRVAKLIEGAAQVLPPPDDPDFGTFFERLGEARVVLLGEATHGTSEFYQARAEITKRLIRYHGFTVVAVEADWPDAGHIDAYINDRERPLSPNIPFQGFPTWMWRNEEILALVDWLRDHNASVSNRSQHVGFHGLDLYSLGSSLDAVTGHLAKTRTDFAERAREHYSCILPYRDEPSRYGSAAVSRSGESCEKQVEAVLDLVRRIPQTEGGFDAVQNARAVLGAERYYRSAYAGAVVSWNLRDQHMFETLRAVLEARGPSTKAIVWAHNSHVGNAAGTEMGRAGQFNIGQLCREHFGDMARLVGFGTDRGTVMAASEWGGEPEVKRVRPSLPTSYEAIFRTVSHDRFILDLRKESMRKALSLDRIERAIGVMYLPESERVSHYFRASLPEEFDAYVWIEETRAVTPIQPAGRAGLPDGHPFGTEVAATGSFRAR